MTESLEIIGAGIAVAYFGLLATAIAFDVASFRIPNWLNGALVILFMFWVVSAYPEVNWLGHLAVGVAVLVVGAAMFRFGVFGGGDVKLLAAVALWTGPELLPAYLVIMGVMGGGLALGLIVARKLLVGALVQFSPGAEIHLPRVLVDGESVPFGVAIAAAGFVVALGVPSLAGIFL